MRSPSPSPNTLPRPDEPLQPVHPLQPLHEVEYAMEPEHPPQQLYRAPPEHPLHPLQLLLSELNRSRKKPLNWGASGAVLSAVISTILYIAGLTVLQAGGSAEPTARR
jgi:hypothetical protein